MHSHSRTKDIQTAFLLNLGFAILEVVGGIWTNSLAIVSDALHDFVDSLSLGLSWYLDVYSEKEEDERYSYGYRRFSLLAAFINVVVLSAGSVLILSEAIPRLWKPERTNAQGMVLLAVVGIAVNGLAALRLYRDSVEDFRKALEVDPGRQDARRNIGTVVEAVRDLPDVDPAITDFKSRLPAPDGSAGRR